MHGTFLSFPRRGDSVVFAGLEQAQNLAGKDIRRPISDPFSRCRVCGKLSQIVKAIRRKRIAFSADFKGRVRREQRHRRTLRIHALGMDSQPALLSLSAMISQYFTRRAKEILRKRE